MQHSTIAAIATAPGAGGIAIVRLSGPESYEVAAKVFRPANPAKKVADAKGYTAMFGAFVEGEEAFDEGVALFFCAPHSYTGEDVVELSCHGGSAVARRLVEACIAAGASPAAPGEYTRRAFLNLSLIHICPLQRIFHIGTAAMNAAGDALTALGISFTAVTRDTNIIAQVMAGESTVTSAFTADQVSTITEFGQHMDFFGIDLTRVPQYNLSADNLPLLILPILAIVTMFISTHISMKASGQQMQGSMKATMYMMPLMYLFFCFTVPCAFSLYYVISNVIMTVQTQVMRKIYDPEKVKEEVMAEIAAHRKEQKRGVKSTTLKVKDEKTGEVVEKNVSASEMNKRRLEYARQLDEEKYKDERTVPLSELENKKED